uniref:Large ribosomal subunit protein uL4m n=1 Tax=Riptortus pedestris TaxID=329032 RepID=R4WQM4_RIPPE|nr:mitochondrial ribosomal protein L4 [Riptortus pedestris]
MLVGNMGSLCPLLSRKLFKELFKLKSCYSTATAESLSLPVESEKSIPLITSRELKHLQPYEPPRQAWLENLNSVEEKKLGIIDLHPDVFGVMPRIDIIHENVKWQSLYKRVSYANTKVRSEVRGGGRKPWPQKGQGRARHGSIRSPLWKGGGVAHGPRSPTTYFYMLPFFKRVIGLTSTLSIKLAQDDLHIVENLEIPTDDPQFLKDLVHERNWGMSVLFVDVADVMPRNITAASDEIKHMNLMPVYGLNVHSMLKHETLVLTLDAVNKIEERILYQLHRTDDKEKMKRFKASQV